jgi:glycosyltransferase involved in cell wall biosynthesis
VPELGEGATNATEPVRVLLVVKGLGLGGTERLLLETARARDRTRFEYDAAYLLPGKDALVPDLETEGVRTHCLGRQSSPGLDWPVRLRQLLRSRRFHIVHAHSPYPGALARIATRSLAEGSRPLLFSTEHNAYPTYSLPARWLTRATSRMDKLRIAVSRYVAESFPDRHRMRVIVQGVPLHDVRQKRERRNAMRTKMGVLPDQVLVGTVANYVNQKDYPNFFGAAQLVSRGGSRIRFCSVGQGPLAQQIESLHAAMDLEGNVELLGLQRDAVSIMAACDIVVLASRFEGLPVALMEAMALGLPVVATRVGGVPEAVRDGVEGLLVPPTRPDLLANAIDHLGADEELRQTMGAAAAERSAMFDIAATTRAIERLYHEALGHA